jgi:hypothetical protein
MFFFLSFFFYKIGKQESGTGPAHRGLGGCCHQWESGDGRVRRVGKKKEHKQQQILARIWGKRNPHTLMVRL